MSGETENTNLMVFWFDLSRRSNPRCSTLKAGAIIVIGVITVIAVVFTVGSWSSVNITHKDINVYMYSIGYDFLSIEKVILFLPLLQRFNPVEPVVEKSVIL
jgi:hypothetical protein